MRATAFTNIRDIYVATLRSARLGFRKYAVFAGRAPLTDYTYWLVFLLVASAGLTVIDAMLSAAGLERWSALTAIFQVATLVPFAAFAVRRLHDTGRSGWWCLISLLPFVGAVVLVLLLMQPGASAPNTYGPGFATDTNGLRFPHFGGRPADYA